MELQEAVPALETAGVRLYALSYDEPEALRDFRDAYGITYTLLSDPHSAVIRQLGILNTLIDENDHPWFGIPFPGSYIIAADGRITHKFFENNLALRVGPEQLLRAIDGEPQEIIAASSSNAGSGIESPAQVAPEVFLEGPHLTVGVMRNLVARFKVPAGRHLYAQGAPSGMVAVNLELDQHPLLVTRDLELPASESHVSELTGETLEVHHGVVELLLPVTVNGSLVSTEEATDEITLSGTLRWQICDDEVCDVPQSRRFELKAPVTSTVTSELMGKPGERRIRAMNGADHFKKMTSRRETP